LTQTICLTRSRAGDDSRWRAVGNGVYLGGCGGAAEIISFGRSEDDCDEVEELTFTTGSTAVLVVLDVDLNQAVLVELGSFQSRGGGFRFGYWGGCGLQSIQFKKFSDFIKPVA
jgi:hypothetical protein